MNEKLQPNDLNFWTIAKTRWGDMDGLRHINHAAYLSYMETARMEWLESLGISNQRWDAEIGVILAKADVDYFAQIYHPEEMEIGLGVPNIGSKSFHLLTGIFKSGKKELLVQATFILVAFNYRLNKSIPVPEFIKTFSNR